ncbi:B12-binding domain-containing radical SAM protein [Flammeovirga pacifica]|uniref:Radical SAM protein n=1 Tax=Flammeovirga pacifica TaxID=915059 RepID=A0A1S1Z1I7_FLAPC|nr:radical SAM protein [Flammeovirga pacifica]OHX67130.1 radical SAM protein [Flammeovirga pacifica]
MIKTLLVTPPLTQLNTPYPATAYLKGFLREQNIEAHQIDLGLELVLKIFSVDGLTQIFDQAEDVIQEASDNVQRIFMLQDDYLETIQPVVQFLQNKDNTLAHSICQDDFLPRASRFNNVENVEWTFGTMGINDKARYLSTLYLEDIGDFIIETITEDFGFSRYAERIAMSATSFNPIEEAIESDPHILDQWLLDIFEEKLQLFNPEFVAFTVPFPGNLYGALKCGQYLKSHYPHIKVAMGGGYPNTELRTLKDPRVFNYIDFITLDDGEGPLMNLLQFIKGDKNEVQLQRTFKLTDDGEVTYINQKVQNVISHANVGTPDYSDLLLDQYLSVIDVANPMHRLWNDGRWNKLTVAHGCYWKKCTFCDISLDYIGRYDPAPAQLIVDRIEQIVKETGQTGFHFVDEAAPPLALRDIAIELIKRGTKITWWGNIRFEKTFTADLCRLLSASGCVAVSGGIEVASDRLLKLMKKGVTIKQAAQVTKAFSDANIMVHAYLMYGFPTQNTQETIDSLEVVRQMFAQKCLHSGFWHQFAMTAHAPVGLNPEEYKVEKEAFEFEGFAWNDLPHIDPTGAKHDRFSQGLKTSIFNYMHGLELELPVQNWFDFSVSSTTLDPTLIEDALGEHQKSDDTLLKYSLIWLGKTPMVEIDEEEDWGELIFINKKEDMVIETSAFMADFIAEHIEGLSIYSEESYPSLLSICEAFEEQTGLPKEDLLESEAWEKLRKNGLLLIRL